MTQHGRPSLCVRIQRHILLSQDMVNGAFPDAENDGPNAFISFIDSKCDPENRLSVGVDARSIGRELLCEASGAYTLVHNEVKMAFDKLRAERNPCRINPTIKPREYASKNSNYTFFGWRLGKMAEEGTHTVRTVRKCHICAFDRPVKIEGESGWQSYVKSDWNIFRSKRSGQLSCNIDYSGTKMEDHKSRLAPLDLFPESLANGTSAFRTLDKTVAMGIKIRAQKSGSRGFWQKVRRVKGGEARREVR